MTCYAIFGVSETHLPVLAHIFGASRLKACMGADVILG